MHHGVPSFGKAGGRSVFCAEHAENYMVNLVNKQEVCGRIGCNKQPLYGKIGGKAEFCAEHADRTTTV